MEGSQYCGGIPSVLWGIQQYMWGDSFSTVEVVQYSGGITSVQCWITSVQCWIASVLWRVFSTLGDNISTCGDNISTVGDIISTVEGIQYSGEEF